MIAIITPAPKGGFNPEHKPHPCAEVVQVPIWQQHYLTVKEWNDKNAYTQGLWHSLGTNHTEDNTSMPGIKGRKYIQRQMGYYEAWGIDIVKHNAEVQQLMKDYHVIITIESGETSTIEIQGLPDPSAPDRPTKEVQRRMPEIDVDDDDGY